MEKLRAVRAQLRTFCNSNAFLRALIGPIYAGRKSACINDIDRRATARQAAAAATNVPDSRMWRRRARGEHREHREQRPRLVLGELEELDPGCLYVHGHPGLTEWRWCGASCLPGKPYCGEHEPLTRQSARSGGRRPSK